MSATNVLTNLQQEGSMAITNSIAYNEAEIAETVSEETYWWLIYEIEQCSSYESLWDLFEVANCFFPTNAVYDANGEVSYWTIGRRYGLD